MNIFLSAPETNYFYFNILYWWVSAGDENSMCVDLVTASYNFTVNIEE